MAGKHRDGKHGRAVKRLLAELADEHGVELITGYGDPHYWFEITLNGHRRRGSYGKNKSNEKGQLACVRRDFVSKVQELKRENSK